MSAQTSSARAQQPPSAAARMAAVKACTLGARREPGGAARMRSYMARLRAVSPLRVATSISVVHMRQSGSQPAASACSHT